jgi:serine protease Do
VALACIPPGNVYPAGNRALTGPVPLVCPLPIIETKTVIERWLMDSGFKTDALSREPGYFEINALKGKEVWRIMLKPYSPLASSVTAEYTFDGLPESNKIRELQLLIDNYRDTFSEVIPAAVLLHRQYIVCINAGTKEESIHFSGFMVGKDGLVIATAHDLDSVRDVTLSLSNGDEVTGSVSKIDVLRDLILIDINRKIHSSISLTRARNLLEMGETVYSMSCSDRYQSSIHSGIIDGPLGQVNNMPLWQVEMQTLHGASGGPVFDSQGNLVGIVKGRYRGTNLRGFLITMETLTEFLRDD